MVQEMKTKKVCIKTKQIQNLVKSFIPPHLIKIETVIFY